ncbi:hypothetical protein MN0502_34820 (plasmid) [Arthrobacter sp. MN05-02]|nr:hypothetical protein MN0502_34820 [Arthrobacter sp. MN05-02]
MQRAFGVEKLNQTMDFIRSNENEPVHMGQKSVGASGSMPVSRGRMIGSFHPCSRRAVRSSTDRARNWARPTPRQRKVEAFACRPFLGPVEHVQRLGAGQQVSFCPGARMDA